jgi:hypothetical protein
LLDFYRSVIHLRWATPALLRGYFQEILVDNCGGNCGGQAIVHIHRALPAATGQRALEDVRLLHCPLTRDFRGFARAPKWLELVRI